MRVRAAIVTAAALAVCATLFAQGPRKDGEWEITMKMDMPGMPMQMPPIVTKKCISAADANDPLKTMPQAGRGGRGPGERGRTRRG